MAEEKYMSGRYGGDSDGGVSYSEGVFERSRDRISKKQKYFERFNKLYLPIKLGVGLANSAINDKAQAQQNELNFQFANHKIVHDDAMKVLATYKENQENNISNRDYLYSVNRTRIIDAISKKNPNIDLDFMSGAINDNAYKLADEQLEAYESMLEDVKDLPQWDPEGTAHLEWWKSTQGKKAPRNIRQLIGRRVSDWWGSRNEETLKEENSVHDLTDENLLKYNEFEKTFAAYQKITGTKGINVSTYVEQAKKEGKLKGVIVPELTNAKIQTRQTSDGLEQPYMVVTRKNPNISEENPNEFISEEILLGKPYPVADRVTMGDVNEILDMVKVNSASYNRIIQAIASDNGRAPTFAQITNALTLIDSKDLKVDLSVQESILETSKKVYDILAQKSFRVVVDGVEQFEPFLIEDNMGNFRRNERVTDDVLEKNGFNIKAIDAWINSSVTDAMKQIQPTLDGNPVLDDLPEGAIRIDDYASNTLNLNAQKTEQAMGMLQNTLSGSMEDFNKSNVPYKDYETTLGVMFDLKALGMSEDDIKMIADTPVKYRMSNFGIYFIPSDSGGGSGGPAGGNVS